MPMITVSGNDVIILSGQRNSPNGYGLLTVIKMQEAPHLARCILFERSLLETADSYDVSKNANLPFGTQLLVDGSGGVVDGGVHVTS